MELPHVGMPNAGEEWASDVPDVHEGMLLAVLFVAIVLIVVGMALGYFATGAVFSAALLPGIVDHQPRERRLFKPRRTVWEWFDAHKDAVAGYAILAFVVLFATGVLK